MIVLARAAGRVSALAGRTRIQDLRGGVESDGAKLLCKRGVRHKVFVYLAFNPSIWFHQSSLSWRWLQHHSQIRGHAEESPGCPAFSSTRFSASSMPSPCPLPRDDPGAWLCAHHVIR